MIALLGHWRLILTLIGFAIMGTLFASAKGDARHWHKESDRFAGLYHSEQLGHAATVANYRLATAQAKAVDEANARRKEQAQAVISEEQSHVYQTNLASLRARYDALRLRASGAASANPGSGGGAGLPGAAQASLGPDAAAGEEGFSLDDRLICSAQAEQLDALITWVERQGGAASQ